MDIRFAAKKLGGLVSMVVLGALPAKGVINVSQAPPYESGGSVRVETTLSNDTGVTLDSASLDYSQLLYDVANLDFNIPRFDTNADNKVEFGPDNLVSQLNPYLGFSVLSTGDVSNGWSGTIGSDGIVDITHISGFPGFSYDEFTNNSNQKSRLILGNYIVENPVSNTIVPIDLNPNSTITDFASGTSGASTITADGQGYNVVPEPSQVALGLGFLSAAAALYRRRKTE